LAARLHFSELFFFFPVNRSCRIRSLTWLVRVSTFLTPPTLKSFFFFSGIVPLPPLPVPELVRILFFFSPSNGTNDHFGLPAFTFVYGGLMVVALFLHHTSACPLSFRPFCWAVPSLDLIYYCGLHCHPPPLLVFLAPIFIFSLLPPTGNSLHSLLIAVLGDTRVILARSCFPAIFPVELLVLTMCCVPCYPARYFVRFFALDRPPTPPNGL